MSGLMNAISRGLSQAGYAAGDMYARQSMAEQASQQQTERDKRLAELQETAAARAEDRRNAPMNRLGAKARELAAQDVPREDQPVTELSGRLSYDGVGPGREGFTGDLATVQKAIAAMPEGADKKAAMTRLQQQLSEDNATAGLINAGQTRKRTADEALSAAADDAKVNDPIAYAEYETRIGKPMRDERKLDDAQRKAENDARLRAESEIRKERDSVRSNETTRYLADLRSKDANKRLEALIKSNGSGEKGIREALSFIDGQRKDIASEANQIRQLYKTELGNFPNQKSQKALAEKYDPLISALDEKRRLLDEDFSQLRGRVGLPERTKPEAPAKPPAAASSNRASQFKVIR